jgi:hypothetical protein
MEKEEDKKEKGKFGIIVSIFFAGFLGGLFSGIAFRFKQSVELDSILLKSITYFCDALKGLLSDTSPGECGINFSLVAIILSILGIIGIVLTVTKLKNWILGLVIFGIGYLVGFGVALLF